MVYYRKCVSSGVRILKMRGGGDLLRIAKDIKNLQDFHATNIITLLTLLQYKKRVFFLSHFFLLCFVVGKHASHSLQEIEEIEKGNVCSCKKT